MKNGGPLGENRVGLGFSYIGLRKIYIGLGFSYIGLRKIYIGLSFFYIGLRKICEPLRSEV